MTHRDPMPYIDPMLTCHRVAMPTCALAVGLLFAGVTARWAIYVMFAAAAAFVAATWLMWLFMFLAARRRMGAGYATRQLVLAVLLSPILFMGVFIVPLVVRSDLRKWDETGRRGSA